MPSHCGITASLCCRYPVKKVPVCKNGVCRSILGDNIRLMTVRSNTWSLNLSVNVGSHCPSSMPSEPTFLLEKLDSFTGVTILKIGNKVPMKLSIWLPQQTYDMHVELLTPYESSAILTICDPVVTHIGSNFGSGISTSVVLDAHAGDKRWDRAVIDFGSVSNIGTDANDADQSKIVIDFSVVMVDNNATQDQESYTISTGVAYNTEVWIGQVAFTATLDRDDWTSPSPSVIISGPTEIYQDTSALFLVDMIIREYASDIRLDVMTESETEPIMSVCSMSVGSYGESYGCLSKDLPHFQSHNTTAEYNETASFAFGSITNAGKRSRVEDNDVADTITVQVAVYLTNSTEVVEGKTYWLGVSMTVNNDDIHSNQYGVTALTNQGATLTQEPAFEFFAADGNDVIIEGHVGLILTMTIVEGSTTTINLDMSMPEDSGEQAVLSICSAEVYYVGYNFPCLGTVTPTYTSQDGEDNTYTRLNFGRVTNVGRRFESGDSTIKVRVVAKMLPTATSGSTYMVSANVQYELSDEDVLWVGQIPITSSESMSQDYDATKMPTIELVNRAEDNYIYKNSGLSFNIDLTVPSSTTFSPFSLTLGVPEDETFPLFSVCNVQVATIGSSFSCYTTDQFTIIENELEAGNLANITLEPFTNPVFETPLNNDDNKIIFEVHLKMKDHPFISSGDLYNISVALNYGQQSVSSQIEFEVSFDDPEYTENNEDPQFEFTLDSGRVSALVLGETAVYTMVVYTPTSSATTYSVDVVAKNNTLSVCRTEILDYGKNLPCLYSVDRAAYFSYEKDGMVDRGFLDLGVVRNTGYKPIANGPDNYMIAQVVVRLDEEVDTSFDVTVGTGLTNIWSTTRNVTFNPSSGTSAPNISPRFNFSKANSFDSVTKGGSAAFNMDIYIPFKAINTYSISFTGVPGTATICEARVISSGWNIPCVNGSFFTTIYNTSVLGGNNDIASIDAGVITNMEWNSNLELETIENMVRVQLIVQLNASSTEGDVNLQGIVGVDDALTELDISFTVQEGFNDEETNSEPIFTVFGPHENYTSNSLDPVNYTVGQKQIFTINITSPVITTNMLISVNLPVATDEAYLTVTNVTLTSVGKNYACFPLYELDPIYHSTLESSQHDSVVIDLGVITNIGGLEELLFTDIFTLHFNFSIDPERTMPMGYGIINTTIPIEVIFYKRDPDSRDGNIVLGQIYKTETLVISLPFSVKECTDILGIESGNILDCQLSASSSLNDSYSPSMARINSAGWSAGIRHYEKEYIQVQFGWMHRFGGIEIQGDSENSSIVEFSLSYTKEFVIWNDYYDEQSTIKLFKNDFNKSSSTYYHSLMNPFDAVAIRIHPEYVQESTDMSFRLLRFELYGCQRAEPLSPSSACPTDDTPDFGQYDRGVLVDPVSGRIFVCVLEDVGQPKVCSYSDDNGDSWEVGRHTRVISDHKPLEAIIKKPLVKAPKRLQGMFLRLQQYDYDIRHAPGRTMYIADTLSRAVDPTEEAITIEIKAVQYLPASKERLLQIKQETESDETLQLLKQIIIDGWPTQEQEVPEQILPYFSYADELIVQNDLIFRSEK
ncbi:uncharacterized protein LOC117101151 [Anneissia japonica]|uniref:uncharacterized protein LOC117101151 n=1 Tax=Anneissia japonica TaxID=1529436 RepID=UPI00142593B9|nr:uncharacterized protein LOC117101151 [Anneissia japonica]